MSNRRTPDEILTVLDQAQSVLDEHGCCAAPGEFDLRDLLWEVINDVSASYELALLPLVGQDLTGEVNNTVYDYLANNYGDR